MNFLHRLLLIAFVLAMPLHLAAHAHGVDEQDSATYQIDCLVCAAQGADDSAPATPPLSATVHPIKSVHVTAEAYSEIRSNNHYAYRSRAPPKA